MNLFLTPKKLTPRTVGNIFQHFEDFRNLEHQLQIDSLINVLWKCFSRITEPAEDLETGRSDNLILE